MKSMKVRFIAFRSGGVLVADVHKSSSSVHFPVSPMNELGSVDFSDSMAFLQLEGSIGDVIHAFPPVKSDRILQ